MAEIGIEKKKPIWPWIILVLVILAILYFLVFANDDDDALDETTTEEVQDTTIWDEEDMDTTGTWDMDTNDTLTGNESVSAYVDYIGDKSRMGIDHAYTNNALVQLANAVEFTAMEENVNIDVEMQEIRRHANQITQNPTSTDHAGTIKEAGSKIVDAMEKIQQQNYPDLSGNIEDVRNALQEIDPSVQTLEQRDDINSFFEEAADALQQMS